MQGALLTTTQRLDGDTATVPPLPTGWFSGTTTLQRTQWTTSGPTGGRQLVVALPLTVQGRGGPPSHLVLEQVAALAAADAVLDRLRLGLALGILAGIGLGVPLGLALTRVVLRPLDRMVATSEAIAAGELDLRLRLPPGRNEVARLGHAFDHMVDRLGTALESQRRFVADASHEMRTPLTALQGLSELLLMGADRGDASAVQRTARSMYNELGRLGRLVADLLTLSRLDTAKAADTPRTTVDAARVLTEVAEQMAALAADREVALHVDAPAPLLLPADPDRLKGVILNLVDNALRYTPPGGSVTLRGTADPAARQVRLQVADTGAGIAPADLPHIFDRFYRGDASRARATGNSGLGLAIGRAIVEAHDGTIAVESQPGAGTCFTITLPAG
jgi:two-component system sensor histidine kinase BaeS